MIKTTDSGSVAKYDAILERVRAQQPSAEIEYLEQALTGTIHRGNAEAFLDGNRKPKGSL